ncbi:MAG TPA: ATP-dependent Clp protease ATP-binding subunit ClpX, partial [Polyangia bacterium]|nr:ATP-dependent Clp protease ATP-binding subunit ClpX [Polyangia bacterium]
LRLTDLSKPVGFGAAGGPGGGAPKSRRVTEKELVDYGLMAEFLGRIPVRVELDPLSEEDLFLVMTGPPDAVVREYQALLKIDGVDLQFTDGALRLVAQHCIQRHTGARSLRTIVEGICHDIMFDAPERKGETITLDADFVAERLEQEAAL